MKPQQHDSVSPGLWADFISTASERVVYFTVNKWAQICAETKQLNSLDDAHLSNRFQSEARKR